MGQQEIDRQLRADLRRWAAIGGVSAAVLMAFAVGLLLIGGISPGTLGIAGVALLVAVVMADSLVRLPRPAPFCRSGACVVPTSRIVGLVVLLAGASLSLLAVGLLTADVTDQRAAWVRFAVPPVAALLVLTGLAPLLRPLRFEVGPDGITTSGLRPRRIGWDDLVSVAVADDAIKGSGSTALPLVLRSADSRIDVQTRWTQPTLWVLVAWLEHYRRHPDDRDELAGSVGLTRLEEIDVQLRGTPSLSGPTWFPGPQGSS